MSRIAGLVRERVFAHYFGNSDAGDAFKAALKIPNFLQNLFGEGVLSASFIPYYARLLAKDQHESARRVAWTIGAILAFCVSTIVLLGMLATPHLINVIAPGFDGEKRELTIRIVRILFPGTGLLVLSAWCLGILNSHRQFFLSYSAPVLWNLSIITSMIYFGSRHGMDDLAVYTAWGLFVGSAIQFLAQFPFALRWIRAFRRARPEDRGAIRGIGRSFLPVIVGRGVVQISAYIDNMIASLLPTGAVSAIAYSQVLYLTPIALFGMSVSAAELPELAAVGDDDEEAKTKLRHRIEVGLSRISFFVIPSVAGFMFLGDTIAAAVFQTGAFTHKDSLLLWAILGAAAVGLLPSTRGRLVSSSFYALRDTRTPLKISCVRMVLSVSLGLFSAVKLPTLAGYAKIYGTVGLTGSSAIAAWLEYLLLKNRLEKRIGKIRPGARARNRAASSAALAGLIAFSVKIALEDFGRPVVAAVFVLGSFGAVYFVVGALLGLEEAKRICARFGLRFG
ncbi:MAG: murein biosynthesis integral membrane protein MurJ [Bdellovibrionales bacterium]|nr:murein biosynthesis integral membrane protein MurJ [Bdellovibrionales bacterium]